MPYRRSTRGARLAEALEGGLAELGWLVLGAARLWRRAFWAMGAWFCLGFAVHTVGLLLSARLGAEHATLAMIAFVLGVVATLVALVLMVHSLEPFLRSPADRRLQEHTGTGLRVPSQVFVRERAVDVVASAVGPFLAVYAVWGFVDEQVTELFTSNYAVQGLGSITNFSISFSPDRLRFYLLLAVVAWLARQVIVLVTTRRPFLPLALVGIVAEALWVFSLFALLIILARAFRAWLLTRAVWVGLQDGWRRLLEVLPDWQLPFGLSLPEAVDQLLDTMVHTVLPGAWQALALPLVWLALTATVLGWREFGGQDVLAGTGLTRARRWRLPAGKRSRVVAGLLTSDLRTKYLPVLQALRLVGRAGPRFVGVYLLLATVLTAAQQGFDIALTVLLGPRDVPVSLLSDPFFTLLSGLVFTPVAIALYAAAFDEALAANVAGPPSRPVRGGTRPRAGRRRSTVAS